MVTLALEHGRELDVAVASQNEAIWAHANQEATRLGVDFKTHVIRGVNAPLQAEMRAAGKLQREYISYGVDAPVMGLNELYSNFKAKRALGRTTSAPID